MARNGSGEYSLPANTAAVSGATISSTKFNSIMSDLESTLNTARPVVKGGTGATTASAARTNLGLAIGTDVQAYDAGLASIAGLTTAADKMIYTTASDTYAVTDLSAFARTILDDADASAVRTTIGAGTGSGDLLAANNLSDLGSASTARSNLGLGSLAILSSVNDSNWSGTDLAVANGGTGASTASGARTNLGAYGNGDNASFGTLSTSGGLTVTEVSTGADTVAGFGNATIGNALQLLTTDGNLVWGFNALNSRSFVIQTNQTTRLTVESGGDVTCANDVNAVDFNATSDVRLKNDIKSLSYGLKEVLQLRPVRHGWVDKDKPEKAIGFIAQELEQLVPELVDENANGLKSISYGKGFALLTKAIQELTDEVRNGRS